VEILELAWKKQRGLGRGADFDRRPTAENHGKVPFEQAMVV
jgi:hypothetical protein